MFNAMEGLNETANGSPGFRWLEDGRQPLIQMCLKSPDVPRWIKQLIGRLPKMKRGMAVCRSCFSSVMQRMEERQDRVRRRSPCACPIREYLASLDPLGDGPRVRW